MVVMMACSPSKDSYNEEMDVATVFAVAGQEATTINLAAETGVDCAFEVLGTPSSAELEGATLTLDHSRAIHEGIRFRYCGSGSVEANVGVVWNVVQPQDAPDWPLAISNDGRNLVDQSGDVIFWNGGAAWSIFAQTTREEATRYLRDRAGKGVNVILASLIEHKFSDGQPPWTNVYEAEPFLAYVDRMTPDMSAPGGSYWKHVDWIIREAYASGVTLLAVPSYVGYQLGGGGWAQIMSRNGSERLGVYGKWLGERYGDFPNIVWVMGGDWGTFYEGLDVSDKVDAVAYGIRSVDEVHLMTAHPQPGHSARDDYDRPWLSLNSTYGSPDETYDLIAAHYNRSPALPTFLIEGYYGNEKGMFDAALRAQMYDSLLGGAFGHVYGNAPQWYFSAESPDEFFPDIHGLDWEEHLDDFGAPSLAVYADLVSTYPVHELEPMFENSIIEPITTNGTEMVIPIRYSAELAIAYLRDAVPVSVDFSTFASNVKLTWKHPGTGEEFPDGARSPATNSIIEPPHGGDWILILNATP
jgi:hypothetical protein